MILLYFWLSEVEMAVRTGIFLPACVSEFFFELLDSPSQFVYLLFEFVFSIVVVLANAFPDGFVLEKIVKIGLIKGCLR